MPEKYAIGEHTATYCPQCQWQRDHTIATMDGKQIATVTCTTCGSTSTFTPPAAAPKARSSRAKKKAASVEPSVEPLWEAKLAAAKGQERQYTTTAAYSIGDILLHEQFGKGVVLTLLTKKCRVLFKDKERLMASAN
jgi:Zn ribbon nucleic-acid-binding protein